MQILNNPNLYSIIGFIFIFIILYQLSSNICVINLIWSVVHLGIPTHTYSIVKV